MAKNSNSFLSKLAPEDKRFIKRVSIVLFILILASGAAMYFYADLEKQEIPFISEIIGDLTKNTKDVTAPPANSLANEGTADTSAADTSTEDTSVAFELPAAPDLPDIFEEHHEDAKESQQAEEKAFDGRYDNFDEQAHLKLMRQNAKEYNYKLAYRHGARIEKFLLSDPKLNAEWGSVLLSAGMPQDAVYALQKLVSKDSMSDEAIMDLAFAMHRSGNSDDAIQFLSSQRRSSGIVTARAAIVGEHSDTTKRASADLIFRDALKMNPDAHVANYYYGRYLMERGDFRNSKLYLERAIKSFPNEPRYVARLGMAEFYLKQDSNAETLYKRALALNPYDHNTWFNLGELYLSQANESNHVPDVRRKIRMALEAYLKTIEGDNAHANAHSRIGLILNGNGEYAEAIRHLNLALERMPRNTFIMQQLSSAYLYMQDTTRSIAYLEQILNIDPFNKIAANEFNRITGKK